MSVHAAHMYFGTVGVLLFTWVLLFAWVPLFWKPVVTAPMGNNIYGVLVIDGYLYSRFYGIVPNGRQLVSSFLQLVKHLETSATYHRRAY